MNTFRICHSLAVILVIASPCAAEIKLPAKEKFHIFVLAGQSNMAGRGHVANEDKTPHPRVLVLTKEGRWAPAIDPLHYDKVGAGVGLGKTFGTLLAEQDESVTIGLVPTACGGSSIATWVPGGYHGQTKSHPYDDALARTRRALQDGELYGILWHQGESDSSPERGKIHAEQLAALINRFRTELRTPHVPFVIGQLGQFPQRPWTAGHKLVNESHLLVAKSLPAVKFVPSTDLTPGSDQIHFDAKSQREFGHRYAAAYLELRKQRETKPRRRSR